MLLYAHLQHLGESTLGERIAMLKAHHKQVETSIQHMQECLSIRDYKITLYENILQTQEAEKGEKTKP